MKKLIWILTVVALLAMVGNVWGADKRLSEFDDATTLVDTDLSPLLRPGATAPADCTSVDCVDYYYTMLEMWEYIQTKMYTPTTSPGMTGYDSDAPGSELADKEVGSIEFQYIDGAEDAENGKTVTSAMVAGTSAEFFRADGSTGQNESSKTINMASGQTLKINGTALKDVSESLANKTIDAASNVIKGTGYYGPLTSPDMLGDDATRVTDNGRMYGSASFSGTADEATNYALFSRLQVPIDLNGAAGDMTYYFQFVLGDDDTDDHVYKICMADIATSGANGAALGNCVTIPFTPDASGASGDIETVSGTLTGWRAALASSQGNGWTIGIYRDGNADDSGDNVDASDIASYYRSLVIGYPFTQ